MTVAAYCFVVQLYLLMAQPSTLSVLKVAQGGVV